MLIIYFGCGRPENWGLTEPKGDRQYARTVACCRFSAKNPPSAEAGLFPGPVLKRNKGRCVLCVTLTVHTCVWVSKAGWAKCIGPLCHLLTWLFDWVFHLHRPQVRGQTSSIGSPLGAGGWGKTGMGQFPIGGNRGRDLGLTQTSLLHLIKKSFIKIEEALLENKILTIPKPALRQRGTKLQAPSGASSSETAAFPPTCPASTQPHHLAPAPCPTSHQTANSARELILRPLPQQKSCCNKQTLL